MAVYLEGPGVFITPVGQCSAQIIIDDPSEIAGPIGIGVKTQHLGGDRTDAVRADNVEHPLAAYLLARKSAVSVGSGCCGIINREGISGEVTVPHGFRRHRRDDTVRRRPKPETLDGEEKETLPQFLGARDPKRPS